MLADHVADATRSRMQHHPNRLLGVEADFDEVVAAAERPQLRGRVLHREMLMLRGDGFEALSERGPLRNYGIGRCGPGTARRTTARSFNSMRHVALDCAAHSRQGIRQV